MKSARRFHGERHTGKNRKSLRVGKCHADGAAEPEKVRQTAGIPQTARLADLAGSAEIADYRAPRGLE